MKIPKVLAVVVLFACGDNDIPPPCKVTPANDGYLECFNTLIVRDGGIDAAGTQAPVCPICADDDGHCPAGCEADEIPVFG